MRWMNRLATATILLTVVAGPPLLATLWFAEHPLSWPTWPQIDAWLQQPLTAGTILLGCGIVATAAWLLLLAYLARRAFDRMRLVWRRLLRMPMPSPAQMTAGSMAGMAALTLPSVEVPTTPPDVAAPHQPVDTRTSPDGVELPGGGWIPYPTAAAVTAASALIWLHRRRQYRPGPPRSDGHANDPDLRRLPGAVEAIAASGPPSAPVTLEAPPPGVLALVGPGAAAAARGLLVTAALTYVSPNPPTHRVRVSATDLDALLPGTDPDLIASPSSDATVEQATALTFDTAAAATARWHVATDGTIINAEAGAPRRVCVLDQQTATDLIDLVLQTRAPATTAVRLGDRPPTRAHVSAPDTSAPGRLELIGGCQLTIAGQPIRLRRSAGLQILAYLAVHPEGASTAELIRACWPGSPPASITQRLHTTLSDLRRQLQAQLAHDPVKRHDTRYQLNTAAIDTDLRQWRNAVAAAGSTIETSPRVQACRTIVNLYAGELAAGLDWPWLTPIREALRRDVLDAYTVLAEHAPPPEAIQLLQVAITIAPDNENLQNLLSAARSASPHAGRHSP
jgi:DNA-binding SARP family transcriptional activator